MEPPSTVGETNPPNEPEPEARPVTPVEEVHSVADTPKKKKKVKKVKKEKKKPKSPPPSSPSLIAQDLASKNLPPLDRPESDATKTSGRRVKTAEVYTALKLNYTTEDPPDEDYEKLRKNTQDFFTKRYVACGVPCCSMSFSVANILLEYVYLFLANGRFPKHSAYDLMDTTQHKQIGNRLWFDF